MILYINTNDNGGIRVALKQGSAVVAEKKVRARRQEAEKLLPALAAMLKNKKVELSQIKKIKVTNRGGSFTSLRTGVVTANALAYALGVPVRGSQKSHSASSPRPELGELSRTELGTKAGQAKVKSQKISVVKPLYGREPEITKKKSISAN